MSARLPFIFIIITVAIDAMGIGLILPVMPGLIRAIEGVDVSRAAYLGGWLTFSYAVMQFIFGPVIGNLSDRFGRRPVLLVSLFAMGVNYVLMGFAGTIVLLFVGRIISGITGATFSTAAAYLTDVSPPEKRAANFGLVGAAFGIGFILGPSIGGFLGEIDPRAPFFAAAVLALGNTALGFFALPETLTDANRRAFDWWRANPFGALLRLAKMPDLGGLTAVVFLSGIASFVYPVVWSFFCIERFGWSPGTIGLSLATYGLAAALVQGWLIRAVLPKLGERRTAELSFVASVLAFLVLGFVSSGFWVFVLMPLNALGVMSGPAIQAMMANRVGNDEQGALQGTYASVASVATIASTILMSQLFFRFTRDGAAIYLPGAPFLAAAALSVLALVVLWRVPKMAPADMDPASG